MASFFENSGLFFVFLEIGAIACSGGGVENFNGPRRPAGAGSKNPAENHNIWRGVEDFNGSCVFQQG
jgi:hypothetical protein